MLFGYYGQGAIHETFLKTYKYFSLIYNIKKNLNVLCSLV